MSNLLQVLSMMAVPAVWLSFCRYLIRHDSRLMAEPTSAIDLR